jgi:tetratricopeptide (TPR) repeat protein
LIYYFDDPSDDSVDVVMKWEKVMLRFPVKVNVTDVVLGNIRKELRGLPRFSWQGWYQAANYCLQNKTNLDQALQWVDRSISMNENFNNLRIKSDLLTLKGQHSAADELMKKALGLANEADLNTYGYQLMGNGDLNKAIEIFRLNIKRYPDSWNVYDSLGEALAQQGKTKEALEYYEKALGMTTAENQKTRIENILKNLKSD